jgi:hypothetical protein
MLHWSFAFFFFIQESRHQSEWSIKDKKHTDRPVHLNAIPVIILPALKTL